MKLMKGGTMFEQRDVVLLPFPYSDLTASKQRPAVIISNDNLNKTNDRICCLITSNMPKNGILIDSFEEGSLPFQSWTKPQRLFTVDQKIIKKKLCKITKDFHEGIIFSINKILN
jgi:mRNA interferase MazF